MQGSTYILVVTLSIVVVKFVEASRNSACGVADYKPHDDVDIDFLCSPEQLHIEISSTDSYSLTNVVINCTTGNNIDVSALSNYQISNDQTAKMSIDLPDGVITNSTCMICGVYEIPFSEYYDIYQLPARTCIVPEWKFIPPNVTDVVSPDEGDNITLTCIDYNHVKFGVTQAWYDPQGELLTNQSIFIIENITRNHSGVYTCVFTDVSNNTVEANTTVTVQYVPKVTVSAVLPPYYTGDNMTLLCEYDGLPLPSEIKWLYNDSLLVNHSENINIIIEESFSELTVRNVTEANAGQYTCEVVNDVGIDSATIKVDVVYTTPLEENLVEDSASASIFIISIAMIVAVVMLVAPFLTVFILICLRRKSGQKHSRYYYHNVIHLYNDFDPDFEPVKIEKCRTFSLSVETIINAQFCKEEDTTISIHNGETMSQVSVQIDNGGFMSESTSMCTSQVCEGGSVRDYDRGDNDDNEMSQNELRIPSGDVCDTEHSNNLDSSTSSKINHQDNTIVVHTHQHSGYVSHGDWEGDAVVDTQPVHFGVEDVSSVHVEEFKFNNHVHKQPNFNCPGPSPTMESNTSDDAPKGTMSGYVTTDGVPHTLYMPDETEVSFFLTSECEQNDGHTKSSDLTPGNTALTGDGYVHEQHSSDVCTDRSSGNAVDYSDMSQFSPNEGYPCYDCERDAAAFLYDLNGLKGASGHMHKGAIVTCAAGYVPNSDASDSEYVSTGMPRDFGSSERTTTHCSDDGDSQLSTSETCSINSDVFFSEEFPNTTSQHSDQMLASENCENSAHSNQVQLSQSNCADNIPSQPSQSPHEEDLNGISTTTPSNGFSNASYLPNYSSKRCFNDVNFLIFPTYTQCIPEDVKFGYHGSNDSTPQNTDYYSNINFSFSRPGAIKSLSRPDYLPSDCSSGYYSTSSELATPTLYGEMRYPIPNMEEEANPIPMSCSIPD